MKKIVIAITMLMMSAWGARAADDKLDLDSVLRDKTELMKTEMEEAGAGDNKLFTIKTDNDTAALDSGDIYKNDEKTFFKVVTINSKGATGGSFVLQRTSGATDPGKRLTKVSGNGPQMIVARTTLLDLYIQGGPFLHPIALLFLVMVVLSINCSLLFRRSRQCPSVFVDAAESALVAGDLKRFEELSSKEQGLMALLCRAMTYRFEHSTIDDIKSRVEITASKQIGRLRIPVKAMNLIAVAAPLLGLLGTIVGMVLVFEAVAGATGAAKASALAAGIRVKLFSTATALCVAIPALFLFFIFQQQLAALITECEVVSERFLHLIAIRKRGTDSK